MKKAILDKLSGLANIFKYLLIIAVVAIISTLFPNETKFKYNYAIGNMWKYNDLHAPFDFALLKTEDQLEKEKFEATKDFHPYYSKFPETASSKLSEFENKYGDLITSIKSDTSRWKSNYDSDVIMNQIKTQISSIYDNGIIEIADVHQDKNESFIIHLIIGNTSQESPIGRFLELENAKEELQNRLGILAVSARIPELIEFAQEYLEPNIKFDKEINNKFLEDKIGNIPLSLGMVKDGDLIISKGSVVNELTFNKIKSFEKAYTEGISSDRSFWGVFIGYLLLTCLIVGVLLLYVKFHFPKVFNAFNSLSFILLWLVIMSFLVSKIENTSNLSTYLLPFCIVPIIIKNFFNEKLALFVHIVIVLIASFLSTLGYEFTFLQILAGIVTVLMVSETRYWNKFFSAILIILLTYILAYLGLILIKDGSFKELDLNIFGWFGLNGLLTLLAYPLIPLLEKIFGFTSSITLAELADMNRPLLKELSLKAPGTLQHSLQVANLSEAAADKIGADSLLVKVGALYHDIGKMKNPQNFIENQTGHNPHDEMNNFESADAIIEHVTVGEEMARKAGLPKLIIEFIKTHHGTTRVEYFYRKQLNEFPDKEFDESLFRYPGPKPVTKEQTIMMMADSLEASSKSLKNPTGSDIDQLVDKIIVGKLQAGQLDDSELSFDDLEKCKSVFKSLLRSIYHVRVEYPPEQKDNKQKADQAAKSDEAGQIED